MSWRRPGVVAVLLAASVSACSAGTSLHPVTPSSPGTTASPLRLKPSTSAPRVRLRARVVGRLSQPVSRAVAVLSGSRIVVLGGLGPGDVTTGRVVAVDPNSWTSVVDGQLREPVHDASGASLSHVVVFGGGSSAEVADVQSWNGRTTRIVGRLPSPRSDSSAVTIGGIAYVLGGFDGAQMVRDVLATRTGRHFRVIDRLRQGVRYAAVAAYGRAVYVFGGELATTEGTSTGAQSRLVQRIDVHTGRVRVVGRLPWGIGHAMAFSLDGRLYLAGGRRGTRATGRIWQVDPADARLTAAGRLPHAISDCAVVDVGQSVALIGGETTGPFAPQSTIVVVRVP